MRQRSPRSQVETQFQANTQEGALLGLLEVLAGAESSFHAPTQAAHHRSGPQCPDTPSGHEWALGAPVPASRHLRGSIAGVGCEKHRHTQLGCSLGVMGPRSQAAHWLL